MLYDAPDNFARGYSRRTFQWGGVGGASPQKLVLRFYGTSQDLVVLRYVENSIVGLFILRSSTTVKVNLSCSLGGRKCSMAITGGIGSTCRVLGGRAFSLCVLSLALPSNDNCSMYHRVGGSNSFPMVFLATCSSRIGIIVNLSLKTSSCVSGPFEVGRLLTEVGDILHECDGSSPSKIMDINSVGMGAGRTGICGGNTRVVLATVRCGLLLVFVGGEKGILSERHLLRSV